MGKDVDKMPYPEFIRTVMFLTDDDKERAKKFIFDSDTKETLEAELERIKRMQQAIYDK